MSETQDDASDLAHVPRRRHVAPVFDPDRSADVPTRLAALEHAVVNLSADWASMRDHHYDLSEHMAGTNARVEVVARDVNELRRDVAGVAQTMAVQGAAHAQLLAQGTENTRASMALTERVKLIETRLAGRMAIVLIAAEALIFAVKLIAAKG